MLGRGSADRDVSGWDFGPSGRGHHRGAAGHSCQPEHDLNKKICAKIEAWRSRRVGGERPYLDLDGIVMKRSWVGEVRNVSLLVASAFNSEGFVRSWASARAPRANPAGPRFCAIWSTAASRACNCRRLQGPCRERRRLPAGSARPALHAAFYRNVFIHVPSTRVREVNRRAKRPTGPAARWRIIGVSLSHVQRVWRSHGLQPHRIRTFKLSNNPQFAAKRATSSSRLRLADETSTTSICACTERRRLFGPL
jgi:hypothetical protein